jgi:hypothetical protein
LVKWQNGLLDQMDFDQIISHQTGNDNIYFFFCFGEVRQSLFGLSLET